MAQLVHDWDLVVTTIEPDGERLIRAGGLSIRVRRVEFEQAKDRARVMDEKAAALNRILHERRARWEASQ